MQGCEPAWPGNIAGTQTILGKGSRRPSGAILQPEANQKTLQRSTPAILQGGQTIGHPSLQEGSPIKNCRLSLQFRSTYCRVPGLQVDFVVPRFSSSASDLQMRPRGRVPGGGLGGPGRPGRSHPCHRRDRQQRCGGGAGGRQRRGRSGPGARGRRQKKKKKKLKKNMRLRGIEPRS